MENMHVKRCSHDVPSGNCTLKQQRDPGGYLINRLKSKKVTPHNVVEDAMWQKHLFIAAGDAKRDSHVGRIWQVLINLNLRHLLQ